jgi:hypothetical protein
LHPSWPRCGFLSVVGARLGRPRFIV